MKPFDLLNAPLSATNLIEAGAGTGKTYSIAGLYARLVLEAGLPVEKILVVTYTKAATEELKTRIRQRLYSLRAGQGDAFDQALIERTAADLRQGRVQKALIDFDRAAIFTIHGFCQRVLRRYAFESGQLFEIDLLEDQAALLQEAADDFWRRHISTAPFEPAAYALQTLKGPEGLVAEFNRCHYPDVRILPSVDQPDLMSAVEALRRSALQVKSAWSGQRSKIVELLSSPALKDQTYKSCKSDSPAAPSPRDLKIAQLAAAMDRWNGTYPLFAEFEKFTTEKLASATYKNKRTPQHPFFDLCQLCRDAAAELDQKLAAYGRYLKIAFLRQARELIEQKKSRRNAIHFDDLLILLHRRLAGAEGGVLAQAVQADYHAALVDEFQDTDPLQFEIFARLFQHSGHPFFMIGDPKQAIYSFRGADVFAYLRAARQADHGYTLARNYRSTAALVRAVNTLFGRRPQPFALEGIAFTPGEAAAAGVDPQPGLVLWHLPLNDAPVVSKALSQEAALELIATAVAGEIARLLSDAAVAPAPEEIAVLVRSHAQAQVVKSALERLRVPAVLYSAGLVYAANEADQLSRLLLAILEPDNAGKVRAALAGDLLGATAADFVAAPDAAHSGAWEERWAVFGSDRRVWSERGFYRMFVGLMDREGVKQRLLALDGGERRVTNLLHLVELLHAAETQQRLGPEGLFKWFERQRVAPPAEAEAEQLRLESDARAVQIITMHRSKGLQYDVVFAPFTWAGVGPDQQAAVFHDPHDDERLTLAIGPDLDQNFTRQALKEALAENLRMLYVALTRARKRAYWVWGRIGIKTIAAPAYLLHAADIELKGDWPTAFAERMKNLTDQALLDDCRALAAASGGSIQLALLPQETPPALKTAPVDAAALACRTFDARLDRTWRIASFSSLTAGTYEPAEVTPDRDADFMPVVAPADGGSAPDDLLAFPGGVKAGHFFHEVLEHTDFQHLPTPQLEARIGSTLERYQFDSGWAPAVGGMLRRLARLPLTGGGPRLEQIAAAQRLAEVEFYFPLKAVTPAGLAAAFAHPAAAAAPLYSRAAERLTFAPVEGFLKGFIDLLFEHEGRFYLIDWKSNFLGPRPADYAASGLAEVMTGSYYFLQYHLYLLALDQLLRTRLPDFDYERHVGGVFYIFLRGIGGPGDGIFYDRPDAAYVAAIRQTLMAHNG